MSNEFEKETPTLEILRKLPLAREIVGDLMIDLIRLPDDIVSLEVTSGSDVVKTLRLKGISDFQAGRIFEREVSAYQGIVK